MALTKDANLVMARANLGLAYLLHPDGKKTDEALDYYRKAFNEKDKGLDDVNRAAFLVNFGVAELADGHAQAAADKFRRAQKLLPPRGSAFGDQVQLALLY